MLARNVEHNRRLRLLLPSGKDRLWVVTDWGSLNISSSDKVEAASDRDKGDIE